MHHRELGLHCVGTDRILQPASGADVADEARRELIVQILLLQLWQDADNPPFAIHFRCWIGACFVIGDADGKDFVGRVVVVNRQPELPQLIAALHPPRRLARTLHRRQQQGHQDANDGNHHEQFDERKTALPNSASDKVQHVAGKRKRREVPRVF